MPRKASERISSIRSRTTCCPASTTSSMASMMDGWSDRSVAMRSLVFNMMIAPSEARSVPAHQCKRRRLRLSWMRDFTTLLTVASCKTDTRRRRTRASRSTLPRTRSQQRLGTTLAEPLTRMNEVRNPFAPSWPDHDLAPQTPSADRRTFLARETARWRRLLEIPSPNSLPSGPFFRVPCN
jgi:hypothetical protein